MKQSPALLPFIVQNIAEINTITGLENEKRKPTPHSSIRLGLFFIWLRLQQRREDGRTSRMCAI